MKTHFIHKMLLLFHFPGKCFFLYSISKHLFKKFCYILTILEIVT